MAGADQQEFERRQHGDHGDGAGVAEQRLKEGGDQAGYRRVRPSISVAIASPPNR